MPTDIVMPQMGESIFEGTLTKWLKKPGDKVQRDEPLFEISTDKVDAEIPAPASGVLREIKVNEGSTVQVNTIVGVIDADGAGATAPAPTKPEPAKAAGKTTGGAASTEGPPPAPSPQAEGTSRAQQPQPTEAAARKGDGTRREAPEPAHQQPTARTPQPAAAARDTVIQFPAGESEEGQRIRSSPLVRRIARENNIDLGNVPGSGLGGRITKDDVMNFISQGGRPTSAPSRGSSAPAYQPSVPTRVAPAVTSPLITPGEIVPMTTMRKKIAEHMVQSKRTSAHVHSVFELDFTRIVRLREREKAAWEQRNGARLTFMPFFARAVIAGIRQFPIINSSVEGDNVHYHQHVNLGIAVALDWGLIVPVLKGAEEKNFLGLQRGITDLAERARNKKLSPDDVQGGTFTITNPGIYGPLFGMPVINQPQVAIMGVGGIFKTPVVKTDPDGNDYIAIASVLHISLGYDHRVIDGAIADQFLAVVKKKLEAWDEDIG